MSTSVMEFDLPTNPYLAEDVEDYAEPILEPPGGAQHKTLTGQLRRKYPTWPAGDHPMVAHHIQHIQNLANMPHHPDAKTQAADYFKSLQSKDSPVGVHHLAAISQHLGVQVPRSAATGRKRVTLQAIGDHINKGMASAYETGDDTWKHLAAYKGTPGLNAWLHVPTGQDFLVHNYERPVGKQGWMNFGSSHEKGTPRWVHAQTGEFKDQPHDPGQPEPVAEEPKKVPEHITHIRKMMGQMAEDYDGSHPGNVKQAQSLLEMAQHPEMRDHLFGTDEHTALQDKVKAAVQTPAATESAPATPAPEPATLTSMMQPNAETPTEPSAPAQAAPAPEAGTLGDTSNVGFVEATPPHVEPRTRRMTGKRWNDIDQDALQEMINAGRPLSEMVDRFDRSEKSIKARMRMLSKNPRPTADTVGIPADIKVADTPASSTRSKAGVRFEMPPRVSDADRQNPAKIDHRLGSALYHDSQTDVEPLFFKLANSVKEYTPQGYTAPPADTADTFSMSPDEIQARRAQQSVKQQGLATGHLSGPIRQYTLSLLKDLRDGVHIPEIFSPTTPAGREQWKQKASSGLAKQIERFMGTNKVDLNEFELSTLAHLAYNRFERTPSKESLRITPNDIEKVKRHYSPEEIEKRHREFYPQQ